MGQAMGVAVNHVPLTHDEVVERTRKLAANFAKRAVETEKMRRVSQATVDEIVDAGLVEAMVPLRWGGHGLGWRTLVAASIEVGKACGSTAWCFSFFLGHEWLVGQYGEELRQRVWEDPRTLFGTSFAASGGKVRPVPGGYRVSGRWSWSSGIDYCHWVALGGLIPPHDGHEAEMRMFALPRRDYRIEDVWNSSAMRGTGSNDIIVEDAFVPEEFTCKFNETLDGRPIEPMEDDPVNVWRSPFVTAFPLLVVGPILGLARGAYETFIGTMKTKVNAYTGQNLSDLTPIQIRIAESAAELDAAELIVYNAIERLSTEKSIEKVRSVPFRALTYRDYILAAQMAVRSVDRLFSVSGARSLGADHPMQRHWRDIHAAASHIGMTVDPVYEGFGRVELGLPRNPGTVMF